jgi:hypothetical protein
MATTRGPTLDRLNDAARRRDTSDVLGPFAQVARTKLKHPALSSHVPGNERV